MGTQGSAAQGTWPSYSRLLKVAQAISLLVLAAFWAWAINAHPVFGAKPFGADAVAYWSAPLNDPYAGPEAGLSGAYLYSPAFLQAIAPFKLLPWEWFMGLWIALELTALSWLLTPLGALLVLAFPPVTSEVLIGNVNIFLAVALVISTRYPAVWALALLTKPSLGVGLTWYLARREWSRAAMAVLSAIAIALASFLITPTLWGNWIERLIEAEHRGGLMWSALLAFRMAAAVLLAWHAGTRNRPANLPIALYLALPIPWLEGLTLLAAIPKLVRHREPVPAA
jgi:hypothetical protein